MAGGVARPLPDADEGAGPRQVVFACVIPGDVLLRFSSLSSPCVRWPGFGGSQGLGRVGFFEIFLEYGGACHVPTAGEGAAPINRL